MALGTFTAPQRGNFIKSTPFPARDSKGHPLVVIVHGFKEDFKTEQYPNERPVAFVMVADLAPVLQGQAAKLYPNAILGGDAVADRLRDYAPGGKQNPDGEAIKLPVKLGTGTSKSSGRPYTTIEPLEGAELKLVETWDEKNPTALQDARQVLQDEADAAAAENGGSAPASNGKAPQPGTDDKALAAAIAALSR